MIILIYDSQRRDHVLLFPHFPCKTYNEYRHFDSLVFCLYPCFVSVVQIFPHRSQRECLSVHVNFCVGSLLYSRFIITIVTFYCRIGKSLYQLILILLSHSCQFIPSSLDRNLLEFFYNCDIVDVDTHMFFHIFIVICAFTTLVAARNLAI